MPIITVILSTANSNALTDALKLKSQYNLKTAQKVSLKLSVVVGDWFRQTLE